MVAGDRLDNDRRRCQAGQVIQHRCKSQRRMFTGWAAKRFCCIWRIWRKLSTVFVRWSTSVCCCLTVLPSSLSWRRSSCENCNCSRTARRCSSSAWQAKEGPAPRQKQVRRPVPPASVPPELLALAAKPTLFVGTFVPNPSVGRGAIQARRNASAAAFSSRFQTGRLSSSSSSQRAASAWFYSTLH